MANCANLAGVPSLQILDPPVDQHTIDTLSKLLDLARRGKITGGAYIALHQGPDYSGDVFGHARQHPIFTLGVVRALEELVAAHPRKPLG